LVAAAESAGNEEEMARTSARPSRLLVPLRNLNPARAFSRGPKKVKPDADVMTLQEHLLEFRSRLVKSILATFAGMIVGFIFANRVIVWMTDQALKVNKGVVFLTLEPAEGFITYFKVAAYIGVVIASPVILYQIVRFMAPGLLPHELKYLLWGIPVSSGLFIAGVMFANLYVIPSFLHFLITFTLGQNFQFSPTSDKYLAFFLRISIGIGLIFQLPALLFILAKVRVVNIDKLRRWRKYAFLVCAIAAAAITPTPDPFNMMIVALPMYALYEVGTVLAYFAPARRERGKFFRRPKQLAA
jgi:sec-independent protein translocase protein TatC